MRDGVLEKDDRWMKIKLDIYPNANQDEIMENLFDLNAEGGDACAKQDRKRLTALCCMGPPEPLTVPTLGYRRVRRQIVTLINILSCQLWMGGRPFCDPPQKKYCCFGFSPPRRTDWGFMGLDCVEAT